MNNVKIASLAAAALLLIVAFAECGWAISLGQIDDFEAGSTQGWREGGSSPNRPTYVATGGNPGGFLENRSTGGMGSGSRLVMLNERQWRGDYQQAGITEIRLDLKAFMDTAEPLAMRIALEGAGGTQYGSTDPFILPMDDLWYTASFGLMPDDLSPIAGAATLEQVLSSVSRIRLLAAADGPSWRGDIIRAHLGLDNIIAVGPTPPEKIPLQAGDADQDLDFDQLDIVQVQIGAKYLTGQAATWGDGDWDGGPGGHRGSPPEGNGRFDQLDVVAALAAGKYLAGPYAAIAKSGTEGDAQTSIVYNATAGEMAVDAPPGKQLTSLNIESASSILTGAPAQNLGGSFDNDTDNNIFKATFGGSFGSLSFGNVAQSRLSQDFVAGDLTVVGSLAGGGDLGAVDLVYVPEPSALMLLCMGMIAVILATRRLACVAFVSAGCV